MTVDEAVLDRAGDLKHELVEFASQARWRRAFHEVLNEHGSPDADDGTLEMLFDFFVLQHRLRNGRTLVEQFIAAKKKDLTESEREMLLGWREVVEQPFEIDRRDGPALLVTGMVDELPYRVRSNMGPSVFDQLPRRGFLIARLVPIGDEWMLSGLMLPIDHRAEATVCQMALDQSLRSPETQFRNPDKLAKAWERQKWDQECFTRFFGRDLVVMPGGEAQDALDRFYEFRRREVLDSLSEPLRQQPEPVRMELPPDLSEAETVAFLYDELDGLGFYAEFGSVEAVFADPDLLHESQHREWLLAYLHDDSVPPSVFRRLADRDAGQGSEVFRLALDRPSFDWERDGEGLLRKSKSAYFEREVRPKISVISDRITTQITRPD